MDVASTELLHQLRTASDVQASGFRKDVTVFRLNAACAGDSGLELAFRRNEAAHEYTIEAAHAMRILAAKLVPCQEAAHTKAEMSIVEQSDFEACRFLDSRYDEL